MIGLGEFACVLNNDVILALCLSERCRHVPEENSSLLLLSENSTADFALICLSFCPQPTTTLQMKTKQATNNA